MSPLRQWKVGPHQFVLEEPDLMVATFTGPTTLEHAQEAMKVYAEACAARPVYLIAHIGNSALDAPARKFMGANIKAEWFAGVVYIGANIFLKTVTKALAILVLFDAKTRYEIEFADTEGAARALIEVWRGNRAAAAPSA